MLARIHQAMGAGGVGEGEGGVDYRPQLPLLYEWPDRGRQLVGDQRLEGGGARPEGRAGKGQPALHDHRDEQFRAWPALDRDRDVAALFGEAFEIARQIIAADHVEHDVDAAPVGQPLDLGDEILRLVIDRVRPRRVPRRGGICRRCRR